MADDLPAVPDQAHRFGIARSAQSHALLEDYAELIADLLASEGEARPTDIARRLGHGRGLVGLGRRLDRRGDAADLALPAAHAPYVGVRSPALTGIGKRFARGANGHR